jgi:hypothetical protein
MNALHYTKYRATLVYLQSTLFYPISFSVLQMFFFQAVSPEP